MVHIKKKILRKKKSAAATAAAKLFQSSPTMCDPIDGLLPGCSFLFPSSSDVILTSRKP